MRIPVTVWTILLAATTVTAGLVGSAMASGENKPPQDNEDFVHGAPASPTRTWLLSAGGRIYDTWWDALGRKKPEGNHPAHPKDSKRSGANT